MHTLQIGHERTHHTTWQATTHKQRSHLRVAWVNPITQEIINKLLCERTRLHIRLHIDILHEEARIFEHRLDGDHIRVNHTPTEWLHRYIEHIATRLSYLQHTCHRETRTRVTVVLNNNIRVLLLNRCYNRTEHSRTTNTRHILETDLLCAVGDKLFCEVNVVLGIVYLRIGDTHGSLCGHACLLRPLDRWDDIARIIQSAEDTGDIHTLRVLHLIHQLTHIGWHRIHTQSIQTTIKHVGLDTHLVEWFGERAYCYIRILAIEEIDLLAGTTIGFHTVKTTHVNNYGSNFCQLIFTWHILATTLPHVAIDKGELNFFFSHIFV